MNRLLDLLRDALVVFSLQHPRWVIAITTTLTVVAALQLPKIQIDTDPEHMLREDEPARLIHSEVKERFDLHDMLVIGFVDDESVFTPRTLARVHGLTETLRSHEHVMGDDLFAPSDVDIILSGGGGAVEVRRLMEEPPADHDEAQQIHADLMDNAMLAGKLGSEDGRALALYVPLVEKEYAEEVSLAAKEWLAEHPGDEQVHFAGLPVAEDSFGNAMFRQMAISAPLAFLVIFLLMLWFFRKPQIVLAPMIVAVMTVIWTMGLLIGLGYPVHIMSSMIPVFLMPIAVLNSVHILTEVHDHYRRHDSMRSTVRRVMHELFTPMTLTSLTTFVGFGSLVLTPIPPVQVFGAFVALGVVFAWLLSLTFNPAYAVLLPKKSLADFGAVHEGEGAPEGHLRGLLNFAVRRRVPILVVVAVLAVLAGIGVSRIVVNDNPVYWFKAGHPLRVAETELGSHLSGSYLAYLEVDGGQTGAFLDPDQLAWLARLEAEIQTMDNVGSTSSVLDVYRKVRTELFDRAPGSDILPDNTEAAAQLLFLYEIGGGEADDLYRLITSDHDRVNIWVQMPKGENRAVSAILHGVQDWIAANPAPLGATAHWAGLSTINVVWQERMVAGMGKALASSFVVVLIMMVALFRSLRMGLLAMLPLTLTIGLTYGLIGWVGRAYDMPTAVLSSLSLGLSIDFAIHFLQRSRDIQHRTQDVQLTLREFFGTPAQALMRNIIVIAVGFTPMFFASLVPYVTVGAFFFAIMLVSGAATLVLLPGLVSMLPGRVLAGRTFQGGSEMKLSVALLLLMLASPALAQDLSADEVARQSHLNLYYAADDGLAQVDMTITDKRGKTRERRFTMLRRDEEEGGEQKYFVYFQRPRDVQRTTFLVWKNPHADDARWIYVPALDLVKAIAASDKRSAFVGSDFSYEDVSGRHWSEDTHELMPAQEFEGHPVYVLKSTPKEDADYAHKLSYVDRTSLLPWREEYVDDKGEIVKLFEALEVQEIEGVTTITKRRMSTPPKGSATEIVFESIDYDAGLDPEHFNQRALKSPSRALIAGE